MLMAPNNTTVFVDAKNLTSTAHETAMLVAAKNLASTVYTAMATSKG